MAMDPPKMAPPVATNKGKEKLDDGFIKVVKKKKRFNGPKPRVQVPSLNVSKPGPSKPTGRAKPNVLVSNPFSALDDTTQIEDCFPELNATLKKFAMRYVETKTIPDPDVFKTWSKELKDYYFSLTKDDGEEVESETDGTAKLMSTGVRENSLSHLRHLLAGFNSSPFYTRLLRRSFTPHSPSAALGPATFRLHLFSALLRFHGFLFLGVMPRKKEPSSLPSRRSVRGRSRPSSDNEGVAPEALVQSGMGLGDNQQGPNNAPQPPIDLRSYRPNAGYGFHPIVENVLCNTNKSISSVSSSIDSLEATSAFKHSGGMGWFPSNPSTEDLHDSFNDMDSINSATVGNGSAGIGKPGFSPTTVPSFRAVVTGLDHPTTAIRVPVSFSDGLETGFGLDPPQVPDGGVVHGEPRLVEPIITTGPLPLHDAEPMPSSDLIGVGARQESMHKSNGLVGNRGSFPFVVDEEHSLQLDTDAHAPPPPPLVVEPVVAEPAIMEPPVATKKGKEIMADAFIKVVKKKKKYNGPKPRVQIPSLNVSKPGTSKPSARPTPNMVAGTSTQHTNVFVSNTFSALDDNTHTVDRDHEVNDTLKKCAKMCDFGDLGFSGDRWLLRLFLGRLGCGEGFWCYLSRLFILFNGPVDKETIADALRGVEPPDPGVEGRLWSSDMSDEEMYEDEGESNKSSERVTESRSRRSRNKPSSLLDGSTEGALRRYGLRNSDGIHKSTLQSLPNRKKPLSKKKDKVKHVTCNSKGKENVATDHNYSDNMPIDVEPCMGSGNSVFLTNPINDDCMLLGNPVEHLTPTPIELPSSVEGCAEFCDDHVINSHIATTHVQIEGPVQINMEYAGDSILNSLSRFDSQCNGMDELRGDDQEVNSDTSNKSNSLLRDGEAGECNVSCQQDLTTTFDQHYDGGEFSHGETARSNPLRVENHEPWSTNNDLDMHNLKWADVLHKATSSWTVLDDEPRGMILERIVACLAKWWENHTIQAPEVRRICSYSAGKRRARVEKSRNVGQEEDNSTGGIVKKYKDEKYSSKYNTKGEVSNQEGPASTPEDVNGRKNYKIWSSKNRKPEKNMPTTRVHFQNSFNGADITNQSIGCFDFHMGSNKLQMVVTNLNRDSTRVKEKGKGNDHIIPNVSSRNVIHQPSQQVIPEKSTAVVQLDDPVATTPTTINLAKVPHLSGNQGVIDSGHSHATTHKKPGISLLETTNRYALLDEEGIELGDIQGGMEKDNNSGDIPKELHTGWIRKQERILNARYVKDLTQDQRFEAKRYILDRLIPLDSTLSSWPKLLVEYFRHLSSLFSFGDGYLAAVRFRAYGNAPDDDDGSHTDSLMEDVESETDGHAVFMKSDGPAPKYHVPIPTVINSPAVDISSSHASGEEGKMQNSV
ncbi:hypothetical protein L1987_50226 [Smallanthus sonchifolius]|uniref:Uncharacterized protein n=1 Tax=Smallanthus sonchifolius TaxID=185202 RepID=A0ACB9FW82_9ASTR|nr:hypothetical protein L1987_50226 [Smallanthus sonchifolius]